MSGSGGWSDDYDANRYVDGDLLCDILIQKALKAVNPDKVIGIIILLAIGILNIASPYTAWYLGYGWRYKNAEPSDSALGLNRVVGVFAVLVAVVMIFC